MSAELCQRCNDNVSVASCGGMVVHNIYIFGRDGACLYYHEWLRPKPVRDGAGSISDDQKMMFGLFFSLKTFAAAMDPKCVPSCASKHYFWHTLYSARDSAN